MSIKIKYNMSIKIYGSGRGQFRRHKARKCKYTNTGLVSFLKHFKPFKNGFLSTLPLEVDM